ncbi:MAG: alpha/beta hydrolase [Acidithiobacillus sp.]|nr:alpha/beta hydrolase [Acidithiobacillus sp.]
MIKTGKSELAVIRTHVFSSDHLFLEADLYEGGCDWLILIHGKAYDKEVWKHSLILHPIVQAGWSVLAPNLRGYGASESGDSFYEKDVLGAIQFAETHKAERVVILGASMGGTAALKALAQLEQPLAGVILVSPAGHPDSFSQLTNKAKRALLLYSDDEAYADNCRLVREQLPLPLATHTWPGRLHAHQLLDDPSYGPEVTNWIVRFLASIAASSQTDDNQSYTNTQG